MKLLLGWLLTWSLYAQQPSLERLNHNQPIVDAHNCYPYEGRWADRMGRALATPFPVSIEQDLAWFTDPGTGEGRIVLVHEPKMITGSEPTLRDHFFERVRPIVERALARPDRAHWPLIILHLDFKTNELPLLQAVWDLLGEYEAWITTAAKNRDSHELSPLAAKPILVLTEDSDAQEEVFFSRLPEGAKLRLFGSAHLHKLPGSSDAERAHAAATLRPEQLLTERPTNYRRWWNNSWQVVEQGGQKAAGEWSTTDATRLRALVKHAHDLGFWIRFYALDGFETSEDRGWDQNYNFGSRASVLPRWKAAIDAGVDLIATDQYEDLAAIIVSQSRSQK